MKTTAGTWTGARRRRAAARVLACAALLAAAAPVARGDPLEAVLEGPLPSTALADSLLRHMEADPRRVADAAGAWFARDAGTWMLRSGTLCLVRSWSPHVSVLVFAGEGTFSYAPALEVEREQIRRVFGGRALVSEIRSAVFLVADSTVAELERNVPFAAGAPPWNIDRLLGQLPGVLAPRNEGFDPAVMATVLENRADGAFLAWMNGDAGGLLFRIDPTSTEPVQLDRGIDDGLGRIRREPVSRAPRYDPRAARPPSVGHPVPRVDVRHYAMDVSLRTGGDLDGTADLTLRAIADRTAWVAFLLHPKALVDSVAWSDGRTAVFSKSADREPLWVRADPPLAAGDSVHLRVHYAGRVMEREGDWVGMHGSALWFPHHPGDRAATFDVTYRYPSGYTLVGLGERVSERTEGGTKTARWVLRAPVPLATFGMGALERHDVHAPDLPPVAVLMARGGHADAKRRLMVEGVASIANPEKVIGADVANSLSFFQHLFGPPPADRLFVLDYPFEYSAAFPGLIHMSWVAFQVRGRGAESALHHAHEVAHQWWGVGVRPESYHDQWLSEGMAEYMALWFVQASRGDNELFFRTLQEWKQDVLNAGGYVLGRRELGPIWLGWRASLQGAPDDHVHVIYRKGAWVFHMLRNLMLDLKTMDEAAFRAALREFYRSHLGRTAATADFRALLERQAGRDLGWFFDQWIYGNAIPRYRFAYRVTPHEGGGFRVSCRVEQKGVPPSFAMYVPIRLDFGDGRYARVRAFVTGETAAFDLPIAAERPTRVTFNDLESVLCTVDEVPWTEPAGER